MKKATITIERSDYNSTTLYFSIEILQDEAQVNIDSGSSHVSSSEITLIKEITESVQRYASHSQ